ncbi:uncharacterized protein DNG_09957 [Cephalotrichum gorgonifer]|uniref:N-acetyltransferase domain-containing protein n=1 Tax=Cephalotrichum gorgonifer TaxID=2041049 RepID=A0AAE8N8C0_9PEZI|nr:uncharacterized protein DNG_09957 [Cephalotrichum gorgonifer]
MADPATPSEVPTSPPEPIVKLPRFHIRCWYAGDVESTAREANSPNVAKWMSNGFPHPYTPEKAMNWIKSVSGPKCTSFAICDPETNAVIGSVGFKTSSDIWYRTVEIGYWLGEAHWGKGIATEAVVAATRWVFENMPDVLRVSSHVFSGNPGSARVMEKAGYEFEGTRKRDVEKNGVVWDTLVYCTFKDTYEGGK